MKPILLILLLLLPSVAWGQTKTTLGSKLSVTTPEPVKQPVGTIRSVSKGTEYAITYYNGAIGSKSLQAAIGTEPLQYKGLDGKYTPFDLTEKPAKTAGYQKRVNMGLSVFEYDSTGRQRYEKGGCWFETIPLFKGIQTEFRFSTTQQKAYYTLTDKSPRRMVWALNDPYKIAYQKIPALVAWRPDGTPVEVKETRYPDSLVVDVLAAGWVMLDPTVIDTAIQMNVSGYWGGNSAAGINETNYNNLRNRANAAGNDQDTRATMVNVNNSVFQAYRVAVTFPYPETAVTGIDSAYFVFEGRSGIEASGYSDTIYVVEGTWTGPPDTTKWNDFTGWTGTTGAYPVVEYTDNFKFSYPISGSERRDSVHFNAVGRDSLLSKMQRGDSLRVMIMTHVDVRDRYAQAATYRASGTLFYAAYSRNTFKTIVYYHTGTTPTISLLPDTLLPAAKFVINVDTTGGVNLTSWGVKYWPKGASLAGDTITITLSGSFGAGPRAVYADSLYIDTLYRYTLFGTNTNGTVWTDMDSIDTHMTVGSAGVQLRVLDRIVNTKK